MILYKIRCYACIPDAKTFHGVFCSAKDEKNEVLINNRHAHCINLANCPINNFYLVMIIFRLANLVLTLYPFEQLALGLANNPSKKVIRISASPFHDRAEKELRLAA
jgi:hypothetical protein